ncbi:MAG TPA: hypothetical protein VHQ92_11070 [Pseudolabrys sp.]|jgi:hypothetical protein|nr:hypothetical protein [Pseudolabrys sp.]
MRHKWIYAAVALAGCTSSPTQYRSILIEMPACTRTCTLTVTATINQDREANLTSTDNYPQSAPLAERRPPP